MNGHRVIVVGAGLGGLGAAIRLAERGFVVTVLDGAKNVGGLLQSAAHANNFFDQGTHFVIASQAVDVDELFIGPLQESAQVAEFHQSLLEGHFFRGQLNDSTGCPDLRRIGADALDAARAELLGAAGEPSGSGACTTAAEFVECHYGPTIRREFYEPALAKLAGSRLEELEPSALGIFHFPRVVLFGSKTSRTLKALDRRWDDRLAYTRIEDAHSTVPKFYPAHGGIGAWPEALRRRAEDLGVRFVLGSAVNQLFLHGNRVSAAQTQDGSSYELDAVVWTVAPELALRAIRVDHRGTQPRFRDVQLFHFVADKRYLTQSFWVSNYDSGFLSYRTTLYSNFAGHQSRAGFPLTVEVLTEPQTPWESSERLQDELRLQGILPDIATIHEVGRERLSRALPIPLVGVSAARERAVDFAGSFSTNFHLVGSGNGIRSQVGIMKDALARADQLAQNASARPH